MLDAVKSIIRLKTGMGGANRPDATDFDGTMAAARLISGNRENRKDVVVVVELASEFNSKTGVYTRQRYNYYTYRGTKDFNTLPNLKAAYRNGRRVDDVDRANSARLVKHQTTTTAPYPGVDIPDGDPLAAGGRRRAGDRLVYASSPSTIAPIFDAPSRAIPGGLVHPPIVGGMADENKTRRISVEEMHAGLDKPLPIASETRRISREALLAGHMVCSIMDESRRKADIEAWANPGKPRARRIDGELLRTSLLARLEAETALAR